MSTANGTATARPAPEVAVAILSRLFFNRTDRVAFLPPWSTDGACPALGDNLDALLLAHVVGDAGPPVTIRWTSKKYPDGGTESGRFRIGSYAPNADGKVRWACLDCDGGGRHATPLADPLGVALALLRRCRELGLPAYLECSGGGKGWHVWIFFAGWVSAAKVRALLLAIAPKNAALREGGIADATRNRGLEVFPKQDKAPLGNQVWLPWWHGAAEGGNLFYRVDDTGELVPYLPDDFAMASEADIDRALSQLVPPPTGHSKRMKMRASSATEWDADGRPTTEALLKKYIGRAHPNGAKDGRNRTGFDLACQLRDNRYSQQEAERVLRDYVNVVGSLGDHRYTMDEALASLEQAYDTPAREPWSSGRNGDDDGHAERNGSHEGASTATPPPDYHPTDTGNAQRVADRHGEDLRFCHPWKQWQTWDGKRWAGDDTDEPARRVKETAAELYRSTTEAMEALAEADASVRKAQAASLAKVLKHCLVWEEAHKIAATLEVLRSEAGIPILPAQLDADPFLLNVQNGTLDLRTGTLRPHRREDYLTKICRVEYDPNATCPTWHKFLGRIIVSRAVIDYLHRVIGYCLTGDVREQALFFFHGAGANGKSTFLTAIREVLGDYAIQAVSELLLAKHNEAHPTERADLFGRRFVCTIETDAGKMMAEALMKQLTGGDSIRARKMRQDFFEFTPTHKIILAANHKPAVRGTDHAVWRRIKLVPFTVTITDAEKDTTLPDKLRAEYPGILAWAVEGCRRWLKGGLDEPKEVREATAAYQCEQDTVGQFLVEVCNLHPELRVRSSALLEAYTCWSGDRFMTRPAFGDRLKARGYESRRGHGGGYFWHGIGLPEDNSGEGR